MPTTSPMTTSSGIIRIEANTRGTKRYCTGSVASASSASICSVTRIEPISAAMLLPTRPVTMSAESTGESSRIRDSVTTLPTRLVALKRANPL